MHKKAFIIGLKDTYFIIYTKVLPKTNASKKIKQHNTVNEIGINLLSSHQHRFKQTG